MFLRIAIIILFLLSANENIVSAQTPFLCDGKAYIIINGTNDLASIGINPSNNGLLISTIINDIGLIDGLGFNRIDNLIYGVRKQNLELVTIDAAGIVSPLTTLTLGSNQAINAADVDPTGRYYTAIVSENNIDQRIIRIDLQDPSYTITQLLLITGGSDYLDITHDPFSPLLYAVDNNNNHIDRINLSTGLITRYDPPMPSDAFSSCYFNPFGELIAFGSTAFGVASGMFKINTDTGATDRITSGPETASFDLAACPYTVAAQLSTPFDRILPCTELEYTLSIANGTGSTITDTEIDVSIPTEFIFDSFDTNPFGGTINFNNTNSTIELRNLSIPTGISNLNFLIKVDNIPAGIYSSQATINNLPQALGGFQVSDDPATIKNDATEIELLRSSVDTTLFRFICLGQSLLLDASDFGNNLIWQDGSDEPIFEVSTGGTYSLTSSNDCIDINIDYEITVASCPFTIGVDHVFFPDSTLSCSEIELHFVVINDSGITHPNIRFRDSLPENIEFLEIIKNPYGGTLNTNAPDNIIEIEGLSITSVIDTIIVLAYVGEIPPGTYLNACRISGFPEDIGPFRESDDPTTPPIDSSQLIVLGVPQDSLEIDLFLCEGETLKLDGTSYGIGHMWSTGESSPTISIDEIGTYELVAFNGCDPAYIFFLVQEAENIEIDIDAVFDIHLGDSLQLRPEITNSGDSLFFLWQDDLDNPNLVCIDCINNSTFPLQDNTYIFYASNESCSDSAVINIVVDNARRFFAPNIFSPNRDGINDMFTIFSPDFGMVKNFIVFDRWGNELFESSNFELNNLDTGWDGKTEGNKTLPPGVYIWYTEIEFLDGITESISGNITIVK
jgi:gliding motility-associated-like protein